MKIMNLNKTRLLRLTFSDKDVIHLMPNEVLNVPDYFVIVKQEIV